MNRYTALTVFREVAAQHGFAAAARQLGLSAAAVSKNVAELEMHLGVRLFNRTTRRMSLTHEGEQYLAHVQRGLEALREGEQLLMQGMAEPSGLLRVSAPLTVTLLHLATAIPAFLASHPKLELDLDLNDRRVDIVRDGFDVAVRASSSLEDSTLVARKLADMPYVVCAAPAYLAQHGTPQGPNDLRSHRLIRFTPSNTGRTWNFHRSHEQVQVPVVAQYAVNTSLAMREAMLCGYGLSLIPRPYVQADLQAGRLVTVLDDWRTRDVTIYAVYSSRHHLSPKVRVFVDFLIKAFA